MHPRVKNAWGKKTGIIAPIPTGALEMRLPAGKKIQRLAPTLLFSGTNNIASGSKM
jgi:hypothetical protein